MNDIGALSLLPPIVAIVLAIWTKQVFISLFLGIWFGWTVLCGGNPFTGLVSSVDACLGVFKDMGNTRVIAFCVMVGGLIALTQRSGGIEGFVNLLTRKGVASNRKFAMLMTWVIGIVIFVESSITCLIAGTVSRPLYDNLKISREKLAYICDSTSAPICILFPLNGWGAFVMGLLAAQQIENPFSTMISAIPYNIYAITSVIIVLLTILTGWDFGPMAKAEKRAREEGKCLRDGAKPLVSSEVTTLETKSGVTPRAINLFIPIMVMILSVPIGLYLTGDGNIMKGSGSSSVFWAVLLAISSAGLLCFAQKIMNIREFVDTTTSGMKGLLPLMFLMMFAFAIGSTCKELGTGIYLAEATKSWLSPGLLPLMMFAISCVMALATGSSWGTFATMVPIGIPMVTALGADPFVTLAAILGGGTFGDHCSPLSDTTIIASMASASDHIDHVRTQFPYAIVAAGISCLFYLFFGL